MKVMKANALIKLVAVTAALVAASGAQAQSAGQWTLKAGVNKLTPKVESGNVTAPALPNSKADISGDTEPILVVTYGITDNISVETALGLPYKHEIFGADAIAGTGKLGEVQALPPTLFAQYRFFDPKSMVRPYVGAGLTYAWFRKTTGSGALTALTNVGGPPTTFEIDNKFTGTAQLGVAVNFSERWFADLGVTKTWLKTKVHFSSGQTQDMKLDPVGVNFGIGYKF
ncbi:OmpW family protein [Massilia arenosa]|uniref:OmpW family protein n=1 Tax=Zemynaea arenosa TaxID=2561931 RepID=A0A4Y9SMF4_9BURK|nr:OmpW family outer membrane protein [Massilia arenosa]TFW25471.1 OmpW family protein [Massilia arenosa]